jgi:hypothetical protein
MYLDSYVNVGCRRFASGPAHMSVLVCSELIPEHWKGEKDVRPRGKPLAETAITNYRQHMEVLRYIYIFFLDWYDRKRTDLSFLEKILELMP